MKKTVFLISVITLICVLSAVCFASGEAVAWPGDGDITASELNFLDNSSGLDFHDGKLYLVDNGAGCFWIVDAAKDTTLSYAEGFENGVYIAYKTRSYNSVPDAEGISVDENGFVYIAAERDNTSGSNLNMVLKLDPNAEPQGEEKTIQAMQDWDITSALPSVNTNEGIEAVEWVAYEDVAGKMIDKNTNAAFDPANYPDSDSEGMVFVALEGNGHVYGFVLNSDGSYVLICDIASGFDGAMALDYDKYEDVLWVVTDDNSENKAVKLTFNGTETPDAVVVAPPAEVDITDNNEGFAIADHTYTVDGRRPVYRFTDGPRTASLLIGSVYCDYVEHECLAFEWVTVKEPSCANGLKEKRCIDCGTVLETEVIASLYGHNNNSQVVYGSRINAEGRKELYCKECDLLIDIDASNISLVFEDTSTGAWYGDAVGFIYSLGYMGSTSTSKYTFEPNTSTTRSMFVTILGRIKGIDASEYSPEEGEELPFSDVEKGQWYTPYVLWAYENSVVMGYPDGRFGVNDTITREQIVSILFRVSKTDKPINKDILDPYTDADSISSYAVEAFCWAVDNAIVRGTSATTLAPKKTASRAEIAQVILNYLDSGIM